MNKVKEKFKNLQTVIAIGRHDYRPRFLGKRAAESI